MSFKVGDAVRVKDTREKSFKALSTFEPSLIGLTGVITELRLTLPKVSFPYKVSFSKSASEWFSDEELEELSGLEKAMI